MKARTEQLCEELLDRVIRIESRLCKLMLALEVEPLVKSTDRPAVFRYRRGNSHELTTNETER